MVVALLEFGVPQVEFMLSERYKQVCAVVIPCIGQKKRTIGWKVRFVVDYLSHRKETMNSRLGIVEVRL